MACWLVWTGLTGPRDRSDRSVAAALLFVYLCGLHVILHQGFIYDVHTHLLHPTDAEIYGESHLCSICVIWHVRPTCVEFNSFAHIEGELQLNLRIQKSYCISFVSFNWVVINHQKGGD